MQDALYPIVDSDGTQAGGGDLVVPEEIRLTRVRSERHEPQHVQLRREEARVERIPPSPSGGSRQI